MNGERLELLARVASMYYESDMTQAQVALRTGYSRSMISRLLAEAKAHGVIEIHIHHPLQRRNELERRLETTFGLQWARMLSRGTLTYADMLPC